MRDLRECLLRPGGGAMKMRHIDLALPPAMYKDLEARAKRMALSLSALCRLAVAEFLVRRGS